MNVDEAYMRRALQLARLGRGEVSPNPMVGAVIVNTVGMIIGEGYHRRFGGQHAEVNAVNSVCDKSKLRDSTMYVTLEPCSHYGKTPPCAELIIKMGIPHVVVGALDPFPEVSGRGITMLRNAGIEVTTGVLDEECRTLNRRFMTAHTLQRPFILLKWAESADGYLDAERKSGRGSQMVISNAVSSLFTHRERAAVDAILVGAGTVAKDDPSLTVRRWNCRRQPVRVVLDANLSSPADSRIFKDGLPTIVYNKSRNEKCESVEYVVAESAGLNYILADLYRRGITSVMIEGGANVLRQFIDADLWDEARVEIGATVLNGGVKAPNIKGFITNVEHHGMNVVKCMRNCVKK